MTKEYPETRNKYYLIISLLAKSCIKYTASFFIIVIRYACLCFDSHSMDSHYQHTCTTHIQGHAFTHVNSLLPCPSTRPRTCSHILPSYTQCCPKTITSRHCTQLRMHTTYNYTLLVSYNRRLNGNIIPSDKTLFHLKKLQIGFLHLRSVPHK